MWGFEHTVALENSKAHTLCIHDLATHNNVAHEVQAAAAAAQVTVWWVQLPASWSYKAAAAAAAAKHNVA
jgi:hypothetical protein